MFNSVVFTLLLVVLFVLVLIVTVFPLIMMLGGGLDLLVCWIDYCLQFWFV